MKPSAGDLVWLKKTLTPQVLVGLLRNDVSHRILVLLFLVRHESLRRFLAAQLGPHWKPTKWTNAKIRMLMCRTYAKWRLQFWWRWRNGLCWGCPSNACRERDATQQSDAGTPLGPCTCSCRRFRSYSLCSVRVAYTTNRELAIKSKLIVSWWPSAVHYFNFTFPSHPSGRFLGLYGTSSSSSSSSGISTISSSSSSRSPSVLACFLSTFSLVDARCSDRISISLIKHTISYVQKP